MPPTPQAIRTAEGMGGTKARGLQLAVGIARPGIQLVAGAGLRGMTGATTIVDAGEAGVTELAGAVSPGREGDAGPFTGHASTAARRRALASLRPFRLSLS